MVKRRPRDLMRRQGSDPHCALELLYATNPRANSLPPMNLLSFFHQKDKYRALNEQEAINLKDQKKLKLFKRPKVREASHQVQRHAAQKSRQPTAPVDEHEHKSCDGFVENFDKSHHLDFMGPVGSQTVI